MKNNFNSTLLPFLILLASCSHFRSGSAEATCHPDRAPSTQGGLLCAKLFELPSQNSVYKVLRQSADDVNSGLSQTKLTSSDGTVLREGPKEPALNPNQVVSFFFSHYLDGSRNRGGTMVQGTPTEIIFDHAEKPAYIIFANQPVRLLEYTSYMGTDKAFVIQGQGYKRHPQGFSTPIGLLKGWKTPLSEIPIAELKERLEEYTDSEGVTTLTFESGVVVTGVIEKYTENETAKFDTATVITFKDKTARVKIGNRTLFAPS